MRTRARRISWSGLLGLLTVGLTVCAVSLAASACGDDDDGDDDKEDSGKEKKDKGEGGSKGMGPDGPAGRRAASGRPGARGAGAGAGAARPGATEAGGGDGGGGLAAGFRRWKPVPAFLGEKIYDVAAIGGGYAVVLTNDNHVGVTTDSGKTWHYQRMLHGASLGVHGRKGGPYFVMGKKGYVAWSRDGLEWEDLPRLTEKDLMDVAANRKIAVGISRSGQVVTYGMDGGTFRLAELPKGKLPTRVHTVDGKILVVVRREVWMTPDQGKSWQPAAVHPTVPDTREVTTSQGVCRLGRVARTYGLVCKVKGTGYGVTDKEVFVVDRDRIQVSVDGGAHWEVRTLPFTGVRMVGGFAGGPYFALGARGNLARSDEGTTWTKVNLESNATFNDLHASGDIAIIVGSGGTVLRSTDRGKSWTQVDTGANLPFNQILERKGALLLPAMGKLLVSRDKGTSWQEAEDKEAFGELPRPGRPAKCDADVPKAGQQCRVAMETSTPETFPRARMFDFQGEFGVMGGLQGLVAVTANGGADWKYMTGYRFWGSIQDLRIRGTRIVVVAHKEIMVSVDGGRTWRQGILPKRRGTLGSAFIDKDGAAYVCGENGTLLKATGNLTVWRRLETGANQYVGFLKVMRAGKALYASGMKGELYRSADQGTTWTRIWTGQTHPVVKMLAEGDLVLAVTSTSAGRYWTRHRGDSALLRSDDQGRHFRTLGVLSVRGSGDTFRLDDQGRVLYQNLISEDMGQTWQKRREHYFRGVTPVGDGSGRYIGNRRYRKRRDLFFVVASDMKRYEVVEGFYHENALLRCDPSAGCWMACHSVLYRPF